MRPVTSRLVIPRLVTPRLATPRLAAPRIVLSADSGPLPALAQPASGNQGPLARTTSFWREFFQTAFTPYYPERHYMRGPGPACAKRKALAK